MKSTLTFIFIIAMTFVFSQSAPPQAFSYSAVARDAQGNPIVTQNIGIQFSILKGSTVGPVQYQENHFTPTNQLGLFSLTIGTGAVQQGSFNAINWGNDSYYLKVGLDINGGTNFQAMGTSQFLSVPYALYAGSASNTAYQILSLSNDTLRLSNGGSVYLGNYRDSITHQTLSFSNDTLKISQGNQIVLPYKSNPGFGVKINDVDITDPSINDVMVGPYTYLTENNYRYDFFVNDDIYGNGNFGIFSDSLYVLYALGSSGPDATILSAVYFTGSGCNGSVHVPASLMGGSAGNPYSRGRIFSYNGSIYYVPLNASPVTLSNPYIGLPGNCVQVTGNYSFFIALPNNPAVTGFGFNSPKLKVTFFRQ